MSIGSAWRCRNRQPPKRKPSWLAEWKNTLKAWIKGKDADKMPTGDGPVNQKKPETLRSNMASAIRAGLLVVSDRDSQILRINYISSNPERAASVANACADAYREMSVARRFEASMQAEQFFEVRIAQARVNLEDSEKENVRSSTRRTGSAPSCKLSMR